MLRIPRYSGKISAREKRTNSKAIAKRDALQANAINAIHFYLFLKRIYIMSRD